MSTLIRPCRNIIWWVTPCGRIVKVSVRAEGAET